LHGLSTFGFAARGIISEVGNNDLRSLKFFGTRFTAPVSPGDALETQVWEVGPGPNGTTEVTFITKNVTSGKVQGSNFMHSRHLLTSLAPFRQVALGGGIAFIKKAEKSKL
jgi:acyl dehydratase